MTRFSKLIPHELKVEGTAITPAALAALIRLVDEGRTTAQSARGLLPDLVEAVVEVLSEHAARV